MNPLLLPDIQSFVPVLLPAFFVAFFVVAAIALAFHRRRYVKRTYVAGFLAVLVVINLVGLPVLPMMYWHKFSDPRPEDQTHYQLRIVTASGDELSYPVEATLSADSVSFNALTTKMRTQFSPKKNEEITRYLLDRARDHRRAQRNRTLVRYLRFPPHGVLESWDQETIDSHARLVGIRLYRIDLSTSPDGRTIISRSRTLVSAFYPACDGSPPVEPGRVPAQCSSTTSLRSGEIR